MKFIPATTTKQASRRAISISTARQPPRPITARSPIAAPRPLTRLAMALLLVLTANASHAARGASPYLPLRLSPEIERQVERVLILAGKPVLARPIAAATVLDALPEACDADLVLCQQVRNYLRGYMRRSGLNHASLLAAGGSGPDVPLPGRHGMNSASRYEASFSAHWQPGDYIVLTKGFAAHEEDVEPTGSLISVGQEHVQVDIGYRDRWWSPMTDSAMLLSTQAQTIPSVTVSNYTPLTRFNLRYEAFVGRMSRSENIAFGDGTTSGRPLLAGMRLAIEPFPGWSIGVNRIIQFGGGERGGRSLEEVLRALLRPSEFDNVSSSGTSADESIGNQAASITSRLIVPGRVPFAVYFEYAGEDTSAQSDIRPGNAALAAGVHFPMLWDRFDVALELSEWQNGWYVHGIYRDGLRHEGNVIGHWGGDWREAGDGVGARAVAARLGWQARSGDLLSLTARTLENEAYTAPEYSRALGLELRYSRRIGGVYVGAEVNAGKDVFGEEYSHVGAFVRY